METFLFGGVFLIGYVLLAQSLECHHCTGVSHPVHCSKTQTCKESEVCFTERILSDNREVFHNSGCTTRKVCTNAEKNGLPCNGLSECVSFCNTNRCNKNYCRYTDHADNRLSCKEYRDAGLPSGVYTLYLGDGLDSFQVYCDMDTAGGGWTVFQRRKDGSVDFYRAWNDYKEGFGNLQGELWLGNNHLHRLTKAGLTTLRVDLGDWEGNTTYAQYSNFQVGPASDYYRLKVSGYNGTAGDSLGLHNGMAFSTKDADHDLHNVSNCAVSNTGAWWYNACQNSNLNGMYYTRGESPYGKGINWYRWKGAYYSLKFTEMKLREP